VPKIGVSTHIRTLEPAVIADLDTLLTALYVELTDAIIPSLGFARRGPGRPPEVTDAELACAQRRHLAQLANRRVRQALADRVRPLTSTNFLSSI
jgi:hypothetical protein